MDNAETNELATIPGAPLRQEDYWHYLDELDVTAAERNAILEALWSIMATFVNIGFGLDSVQMILPAIAYQAALEETRPPAARQSFGAAADQDQDQEKKKETNGGEG